jgi:tRNA 2-selenouridine synthase
MKIQKRFGGDNVKKVVQFIEEGELHQAADLLLKYYDKSYTYSQDKYKDVKPITIRSQSGEALENAKLILKEINHL